MLLLLFVEGRGEEARRVGWRWWKAGWNLLFEGRRPPGQGPRSQMRAWEQRLLAVNLLTPISYSHEGYGVQIYSGGFILWRKRKNKHFKEFFSKLCQKVFSLKYRSITNEISWKNQPERERLFKKTPGLSLLFKMKLKKKYDHTVGDEDKSTSKLNLIRGARGMHGQW